MQWDTNLLISVRFDLRLRESSFFTSAGRKVLVVCHTQRGVQLRWAWVRLPGFDCWDWCLSSRQEV